MRLALRCALTLAYAWSAVALGASSAESEEPFEVERHGNVSKVNGSVRIEDGQQAGDVSTVNGSVTIGAGARVEDVETVNGSLRIDEKAVAETAESVNGGITIGEDTEIRGDIETVNGAITLRRGVRVGGAVANVNGGLQLEGAQVGRGLTTVNGDMRIASGSRVAGGIHVEQSRSHNGWIKDWRKDRNPRITIEQGAIVQGPLRFEREVDLYLGEGVELPAVEGVAPRRFRLDQAQD